jgi:hypothetical protein
VEFSEKFDVSRGGTAPKEKYRQGMCKKSKKLLTAGRVQELARGVAKARRGGILIFTIMKFDRRVVCAVTVLRRDARISRWRIIF